MIFKRVGDVRPTGSWFRPERWAAIAAQVRLDQLVTTKRTLDLEALLEEDSTFYGDMFATLWPGAESSTSNRLASRTTCGVQQRQPCMRGCLA